ncbi:MULTISPECIES: TM1266 family iron-only hydrogenase system putative regulator [Thermosipho]|uniref:Iron-only hydrogenase system regulator n=1 Tax=Thermosipho affectus TaxID=660294 RepID=A0ABX3IH69_9BACT|nr:MULTISPECIES: TM1266 family iron-only hydrogenase system putative regulator [Thermosipho]ANQ54465.1 iron-only hydrogenase system regulator [Thermosipho sp. 1070]APT72907.1 iron-only hydrogenase system regulator [Thermosipho sp. 1063]MBT1247848.1 iron-only hydrogenase system regulator [Thermosipho sp. 1244]ONN26516.1 iron-only hydrogenase system regulator [Thermosipho affectus]OOC42349.1 iron-only hydrogenase system regulator [Thermosipho sp. 1074]
MENFYSINIVVGNRNDIYDKVNEILHNYSKYIKLRVGYPIEEENSAVIFLLFKANNDTLGSFTGKLGQLKTVKVKSLLIKKEA